MKDDEANKKLLFFLILRKSILKNKQQRYLFDLHDNFVYLFQIL